MGRDLDKIIADLPKVRQEKIDAKAREMANDMIAVADSLSELRKARKMTQSQLAKQLGIGQVAVAQLERRSDLLLSTLQRYIQAAGGELHLFVKMKNGRSFILNRVGELKDQAPLVPQAKARSGLRKTKAVRAESRAI